MTVKTSISLTEQQYAWLKSMVEEGRAASISALVQQAVEEGRKKDDVDREFVRGMRELLARRMEGPFVSSEEARAEMARMQAERRRQLGLEAQADDELAG